MALKFRRGTTAQKSGSLAFGEPFINTDLNTLQIGGASGDITLGTTGESSAFAGVSVSASSFISGSGLKITGNAAIDGNLTLGGAITIGDATADTVNVVASLSSSLIPSNDNAFDVGRNDKKYRAVYGNTISASVLEIESGSTVEIRLKNSTTGIRYDIQNTNGGNLAIHNSITGQSIIRIDSGSFPQQTNIFGNLNVSQSLSVGNEVQSATGSFALLRTTDTISGSIQGIGNVSSYSSSVNSRLVVVEAVSASAASALNNVSGAFATTVSSLGSTYATDAELSAVSSAVAVRDAAQDVLISSLQSNIVSASVFTTFSTSVDSRLDSVELVSASAAGALNSVSGAFVTTIANLGSTYATDAELSAVSSAVAVRDAGQDTTISTLSSSVNSRLVVVEGVSASAASALNSLSSSASSAYAKVGSTNTFSADQTITGSLFISQNLIVQGSSSIQNISSSTLNIGTNLITVNTLNPGTRFGGLAVIDSGSSPLISGSILFDSINDQWIFVHQIVSGAATTSSVFLMGPQTYNSLGSEVYPTTNRVVKSINSEHIGDSNITDNGTLITLGSNTSVTGTLVATGTSLVSASAQIDITSTTGYSTFSSSVASTISNLGGTYATDSELSAVSSAVATTISNLGSTYATDAELSAVSSAVATRDAGQDTTISTLSSSVASRLGTLETKDITITLTGDVTGTGTITDLSNVSFATTVAANSVALGTDTTGDYVSSLVAGTNITLSNNSGEGATPTIGLTNNAITIAGTSTSLGGSISAATIGNAIGAVSSSAQVTASVFGAVSGDVTISSTGVATIAANSVALGTDTTGNYVASLVAGTNITLSNNSGEGATPTIGLTNNTISGIALGSNLATLTIGTGLSGTSYNGSTGVTIANTGVTSNVAGTGVTVSGATGAVTISIGQAVATSSNVQFNSLGIGMAASATAGRIDATNDIVAFSSSDIRFKENIKPIENAIDKIRKISGNTYDWKEENKIEHGYEGNDVGVIAQEIEVVLPQLVQTRESGYKAVKYDKLVALLIEGIKEQQLQIEQLRIDLDNCRNKGL